MKARTLLLGNKFITVWNGELPIVQQIDKFIEDNQHHILSNIDFHEGGYVNYNTDSEFFEYIITIGGDNGIMTFRTIITEI